VNDLRELVKKEPDNPLYEFVLGQALLVKGDRNEARAQFVSHLTKPEIPSIYHGAVAVEPFQKDYAPALETPTAPGVNPGWSRRDWCERGSTGHAEVFRRWLRFESFEIDLPRNIEVLQFQLVGLDLAGKKFPQAESRLEQLNRKDPYRALAGWWKL